MASRVRAHALLTELLQLTANAVHCRGLPAQAQQRNPPPSRDRSMGGATKGAETGRLHAVTRFPQNGVAFFRLSLAKVHAVGVSYKPKLEIDKIEEFRNPKDARLFPRGSLA